MSQIKQIKVANTTYDIGLFTPTFAALFSTSGDKNNNLTIGKYAANGSSGAKHINLEAGVVTEGTTKKYGDIQLKPCDDISFYSHHRELGSQDKVHLTAMLSYNTSSTTSIDVPVELIVNCADLTLSTKNKDLTKVYSSLTPTSGATTKSGLKSSTADSDVFNLYVKKNVSSKPNGYLKVRAKAIDLRCEAAGGGGIALQPKGFDSDNNMNKIKFEHGGGDGLEFGTFNAERTSIFTDEYRFKKNGVWYMASRTKQASDKADASDATTAYKYVKQSDDFYDVIDSADPYTDTEAIIKTSNALNTGKDRHTKRTSSGHIEIQTNDTYKWQTASEPEDSSNVSLIASEIFKTDENGDLDTEAIYNSGDFNTTLFIVGETYKYGDLCYTLTKTSSPNIKLISGSDINIEATGKLGLKGTLDFGSTFSFGETDGGIEYQYKYTKKKATKDCGIIKVTAINNHATENWTVEGLTIAPGATAILAQASILDIIKLVNYMKTNNQGPWAS